MLSVAPYYKVRNLCHSLKDGDKHAIQQSANLLSKYISSEDTIIPMPSHDGKATYMLSVANIIAKQTGVQVLDVLSSTPHEPWYNTKFKNGVNSPLGYEFNLDTQHNPQGTIYVIDNVCSTGRTIKAAINKIQQMYPKNRVEGLVLGVVDKETIKRLNYGPDLHESQIKGIVESIIKRYLQENII